MAKPSEKSPEIDLFLTSISGRSFAIRADICIAPPFGCGGEANEFRDEISKREYTISGMCQKCQDKVFGSGDE